MSLISDAKAHMINEIAPSLNPNISGVFQVRLIGARVQRDGTQWAEIELRVVDPKTKAVIKSFGSKAIPAGDTITLEGLESKINFLPKDI